uniref:Ycf80 n=1 Tax=Laurencieae sp. TaxID=2007162 RepID=A0A1Z1M269_9FLOR|nr:hypothetical protein [Laurencieae sp.]
MILFDLSLFDPVLHSYDKNDPFLKFKLNCCSQESKYTFDLLNLKLKYDKVSSIVVSNNKLFENQLEQESIKTKKHHKFVIRNFWQKLINKYWQETIFISSSNSLLENYTNRLKTSGLSVYEGSDYKNFLLKFSKDLLDRKVQLSPTKNDDKNISTGINKNNVYIKYKWLKSWNPSIFLLKRNSSQVYSNFPVNNNSKSFPLFILINSKKQIVLAESSDQLSGRQMLLKFYYRLTKKGLNSKKLYTGLFFTNLEDALEYKHYINNKYCKSTRNSLVTLVPTTINFYYELLKNYNCDIEFRLVPDLKEISDLLYKYRKFRNLSFDSQQNYSFNYFQGQPLYFIKPRSLKIDRSIGQLNSLHSLSKNGKVQYETVFLNYETAFNAWQKYRNKRYNYYLPIEPQLHVFNLETFVTTSNYITKYDKFIFIPSIKTYNFAKKYICNNLEDSNSPIKSLKNYSFYLKSLFYRILWSLTTRQPISW